MANLSVALNISLPFALSVISMEVHSEKALFPVDETARWREE